MRPITKLHIEPDEDSEHLMNLPSSINNCQLSCAVLAVTLLLQAGLPAVILSGMSCIHEGATHELDGGTRVKEDGHL